MLELMLPCLRRVEVLGRSSQKVILGGLSSSLMVRDWGAEVDGGGKCNFVRDDGWDRGRGLK